MRDMLAVNALDRIPFGTMKLGKRVGLHRRDGFDVLNESTQAEWDFQEQEDNSQYKKTIEAALPLPLRFLKHLSYSEMMLKNTIQDQDWSIDWVSRNEFSEPRKIKRSDETYHNRPEL